MSGFKALRDISVKFENHSRQVSTELFTANISEPFEDAVIKKLRDVKLFTSKYRFLEAKSYADNPQICDKVRNEQTITDYEDAVSSKIIEHLVVKAITQNATIKKLLTTPNEELKTEFIEKKEQIIEHLKMYSQNENQLRFMEGVLDKTEADLLEVRRRWDLVVGKLKDTSKDTPREEHINAPMVQKLHVLRLKMDKMRWLVAKLVTSRADHDYDWSTDPHNRLRALAIARQSSCKYE